MMWYTKANSIKQQRGYVGVKSEWIDIIDELNKDNINSLYGGYLVLSYLINETGSLEKALRVYKGVKVNYKPVEHTLELKKLIKIWVSNRAI